VRDDPAPAAAHHACPFSRWRMLSQRQQPGGSLIYYFLAFTRLSLRGIEDRRGCGQPCVNRMGNCTACYWKRRRHKGRERALDLAPNLAENDIQAQDRVPASTAPALGRCGPAAGIVRYRMPSTVLYDVASIRSGPRDRRPFGHSAATTLSSTLSLGLIRSRTLLSHCRAGCFRPQSHRDGDRPALPASLAPPHGPRSRSNPSRAAIPKRCRRPRSTPPPLQRGQKPRLRLVVQAPLILPAARLAAVLLSSIVADADDDPSAAWTLDGVAFACLLATTSTFAHSGIRTGPALLASDLWTPIRGPAKTSKSSRDRSAERHEGPEDESGPSPYLLPRRRRPPLSSPPLCPQRYFPAAGPILASRPRPIFVSVWGIGRPQRKLVSLG
jgi:hypothetical protein